MYDKKKTVEKQLVSLNKLLTNNNSRIENLEKLNTQNESKIQQLVTEKNLLEIDNLKHSLQPHTLRNIIAHMKALSNRLNSGWDALSVTMEYIFYKGKGHFVTIEEEINFVRNYLKLNEIFFSDFSAIKLDTLAVDETIINSGRIEIPHLITVYYLENAFKHGDKTHPHFLKVRIKANEQLFEIEVINKNRPIQSPFTKIQGIGLKNMEKRLEKLVPHRYEIKTTCNAEEYCAILRINL